MTRLPLLVLCALIAGCVTWPTEYDGMTVEEVRERAILACRHSHRFDCRGEPLMPRTCRAVIENAGKLKYVDTRFTSMENSWKWCLREIREYNQMVADARERKKAQQRAQMERLRKEEERRKQELKEPECYFIELYAIAYTQGIDNANHLLKKCGERVFYNPILVITHCNNGICTIDITGPKMLGGKGFGFDMIARGIWAEPGTPLAQFKLVRFESYGRGLYWNPIAIFSRPKK